MSATISLGNSVGKKAACNALDIPRATFYRHLSGKEVVKECRRPMKRAKNSKYQKGS